MQSTRQAFGVFCLIILTIVGSLIGGVFIGIRNAYIDFPHELETELVDGTVTIYKDDHGVPYIYAETTGDLYFGQGYAYASDRLWQLEFTRAVANGELSNVMGMDLIEEDQFLKTIGFKRAADQNVAILPSDLRVLLGRYVDGINFFIDEHQGTLPLEFNLPGIGDPTHWTINDTLAVQGLMSFDLSWSGTYTETLRLDLLNEVGVNRTLDLIPIQYAPAKEYFENITETGYELEGEASMALPEGLRSIFHPEPGLGSNNWVVSGDLTESGKPLLANDMHLGLTTPSIWYEVHLHADDGYHAAGFCLPGVPGIIVGHNEFMAWGFTNTGIDTVDLYRFKENPDNANEYWFDGQWEEFQTVTYEIETRSGAVDFDVKFTRYGPALNFSDTMYSVRWYLFEPTETMSAFYGMNTASSVTEFREALEMFDIPGQNIVYATVQGDIGYQQTGQLIERSRGYGILPLNMSEEGVDWTFVDFAENYHVENPAAGYWATANEKVVPEDFAYYCTDVFAPDYRANRINSLIEAKAAETGDNLTPEHMRQIQSDTYYEPASIVWPVVIRLLERSFDGIEEDASALLSEWDFSMDKDSGGALVFMLWWMMMEKNMFLDDLGGDLFLDQNNWALMHALPQLVLDGTSEWFDNVDTPDVVESVDDIALASFIEAVDYATDKLGDDPDEWTWGGVHQVLFRHSLGLSWLSTGFVPSSGAHCTVLASTAPYWIENEDGTDYELCTTHDFGPSERMILTVETGFEEGYITVAPGQTGHLFRNARDDQLDDWLDVTPKEFHWSTTESGLPDDAKQWAVLSHKEAD